MNPVEFKILVVDDEPDILEMVTYNLQKEGFKVKTASNGIKALQVATEFLPDVILLDIMMPKQDGVETCRQIRETPTLKNACVIFLTARGEEYSEVAAFDSGADDYIVKPIKPRALVKRIIAHLRRSSSVSEKDNILTIKDLTINRTSYSVHKGKKNIVLPKKEFELLHFLAKHPNKVFGRDDLLSNIWGSDVYVVARTVDVHIRKLREKIGSKYIATIKGVGYKFAV